MTLIYSPSGRKINARQPAAVFFCRREASMSRCVPWSACLLMVAISGVACGGPSPQTVVIVQNQARQPRVDFEGMRLLMPAIDVKRWADSLGFSHDISANGGAVQTATVTPHEHAIRRYQLKFEKGRLIKMTIHYVAGDAKRADIRKHYALKRRRLDGTWVMTDRDRQTVIMINQDGDRLVAVHAGQASDRIEIDAMFELFFKEKAGERPAEPSADPKAGDAHL